MADTVLAATTVLVTGGTGEVGWGIAHAAVAAGAHVILPTRSDDGRAALAEEFGADATVVRLDVSTDDGIARLGEVLDDRGALHHVVAPVGSWWNGGMTLDQEPSELTALLDTYAVTQLRLARLTIPRLDQTAGSYTLVTGAAGEHERDGTGLLVVAVNAQYALARVLASELRDGAARCNEVRIATRVEREPRAGVVPSRDAGDFFVDVMAGDRRGETIRYTG